MRLHGSNSTASASVSLPLQTVAVPLRGSGQSFWHVGLPCLFVCLPCTPLLITLAKQLGCLSLCQPLTIYFWRTANRNALSKMTREPEYRAQRRCRSLIFFKLLLLQKLKTLTGTAANSHIWTAGTTKYSSSVLGKLKYWKIPNRVRTPWPQN